MKIRYLKIDSYKHLKDVSFDFTYPNGHPDAGQPLNKICLIGQSAAGKTSILELIKDNIQKLSTIEVINQEYLLRFDFNFNGEVEYLTDNQSLFLSNNRVEKNNKPLKSLSSGGGAVSPLVTEKLKLLYLTSDIISKDLVYLFNLDPVDIFNKYTSDEQEFIKRKLNELHYIYEFSTDVKAASFLSILSRILDYRKKFTQLASELINKGFIGDLNRLNEQYKKWSEQNENPLLPFSNFFNPILQKLNLEIDLINTQYPIPIKSKINDEVIPISNLSTGTKGLLLSMFPLFELDTTDSMILIDEPERSLFPDIQIDLMSHYQRIAPNAQFIVATHSPFIAASFEPEERFILYFDENGKVAVRKGESPLGDDPNDILRNDFNVDYFNDFGKKAYENYLKLKREAAAETNPEKKKELIIESVKLGDKYNF